MCNGLVQRTLGKERVFFWLNVFEPQFPPLKNGESLTEQCCGDLNNFPRWSCQARSGGAPQAFADPERVWLGRL